MNFALLRHIKVVSGTPQEMIEKAEHALGMERDPNLSEMMFYLSAEPNEFYSFSFFWRSPGEEEIQRLFSLRSLPPHRDTRQPLGQEMFRLIWEHRSIGHPSAVSYLHVASFPGSYASNVATIERSLKDVKKNIPSIPGLTGFWWGQCLSNSDSCFKLVLRADWSGRQARQNFIESPLYQSLEKTYLEVETGSSEYPVLKLETAPQIDLATLKG